MTIVEVSRIALSNFGEESDLLLATIPNLSYPLIERPPEKIKDEHPIYVRC